MLYSASSSATISLYWASWFSRSARSIRNWRQLERDLLRGTNLFFKLSHDVVIVIQALMEEEVYIRLMWSYTYSPHRKTPYLPPDHSSASSKSPEDWSFVFSHRLSHPIIMTSGKRYSLVSFYPQIHCIFHDRIDSLHLFSPWKQSLCETSFRQTSSFVRRPKRFGERSTVSPTFR